MNTYSESRATLLNWAGLAAMLGACIGMAGDVMLLYNPSGGYLAGDYAFLAPIPNDRLLWGHYLGILGIPLEAGAIFLIHHALRPLGWRVAWAAAALGIYLMFPGIAYHASVYPMADAVRAGGPWMEAFRPFNEPLGLVFAVSFLLLMVPVAWWIASRKTLLPRWAMLFSPLVTYPACVGLMWLAPPVGNLLAPLGFNLSMGVFAGVMWVMRGRLA